jgi:hypothetical protein
MILPCISRGECSKSYWKLLRAGPFSRILNSNHLSHIHRLRDFLILNFIHLSQSKVLATQQLHAFVIINHLEAQQKTNVSTGTTQSL